MGYHLAIGLVLLAPLTATSESTVTVSGRAALSDNVQGQRGALPAVDAGVRLKPGQCLQVEARGYQSPSPRLPDNHPNGCCFVAEFFDGNRAAVPLRRIYPARLACAATAERCSIFFPISPGSVPHTASKDPRLDLFLGKPFPVPADAVGLRFGHWDSHYSDNGGAVRASTRVVPCP